MKYKILGVMVLLALPLLGWGCSKDAVPALVEQPQIESPNADEEQSLVMRQVINNFKAALAKGDIEAALQQVHPSGKEKINTYLQEMKKIGTLEAFSRIFGEMKLVRVGEEIAEYDVIEEGSNEPLTVTFMKDSGQWEIRDF